MNRKEISLIDEALQHSNKCQELLSNGVPADAIAYCVTQRIQPPQYVPDDNRVGADALQELATSMLADYGWWVIKLKLRAAREAEMIRIRKGLSALGK
jgi:hypothetical protein